MRTPGRWVRTAAVLGLALTLALASPPAARAAPGPLTVAGTEMKGFARIRLEFDRPVKVTARTSGGVVVLSFSEAAAVRAERLAQELAAYVAMVRRDPDGSGLRIALTRPVRPNVLAAGEQVFVDLLPDTWVGLPPGLPPEVVDALARRAREAEAKARAEPARRAQEPVRPIGARVLKLPTLTRLVLDMPAGAPTSFRADGAEAELVADAPLKLDLKDVKAQMPAPFKSIEARTAEGRLVVNLSIEPGAEMAGFREADSFVIDVRSPNAAAEAAPPAPKAKPAPADAPVEPRPAAPAQAVPAQAVPAQAAPAQAAAPPRAEPSRAPSAPPVPPQARAPGPSATLDADGLKIRLPFSARTPAAAFERGGILTLAFETPETVALPALPAGAERFAAWLDARRDRGLWVARLQVGEGWFGRLAPDGTGWAVSVGERGLAPFEPLAVARSTDEGGRMTASVPLADASGVHWIEDGEGAGRIAVVTALGPPRGSPKLQRFVEFQLLPTAHGLAVLAEADDLVVRPGLDGVAISREAGLSLTPAAPVQAGRSGGGAPELAITRERWAADQLGSPLERIRALMRAAAEAPRAARNETRLDLARALLANRFDHEAAGVLAAVAAEDPMLARQRAVQVLAGVALVRMDRPADARKVLGQESLADDPEALLWRAVLDARLGRWPQALAGLRRSGALIEQYPDDVQGEIRLLAARAGVERGEFAYADAELAAAVQMPLSPFGRDEAAYVKARLDEAEGRGDVALEAYRRLVDGGERPVAAEATLRLAAAGLEAQAIDAEEAIARLETLALTWRGDRVEVATLGRLGQLYADARRWREAFAVAKRANLFFPDHEVTRALHDATARLFEDLFLNGKADDLPQVEALALYYDYKEFTPIGRKGDEIVRRLADRLVSLDLLEPAGDLLAHQVEHRLAGAARATVAARLATIRLMDGKPKQALAVLQASRLPDLPAPIKRARMLLETRALSDLSRTDLALETLEGEAGPDVERLRADVLWNGRRWREAGEGYERLLGLKWRGPEALDDQDRRDVLKAAIAASLADDMLALDRLRQKFAAKMADSGDAGTFAFVTKPNVAATRAFRDLARGVTGAETLSDFLADFRKRYPEAASAGRPARPGAEPKPSGQAQAPAPPKT